MTDVVPDWPVTASRNVSRSTASNPVSSSAVTVAVRRHVVEQRDLAESVTDLGQLAQQEPVLLHLHPARGQDVEPVALHRLA